MNSRNFAYTLLLLFTFLGINANSQCKNHYSYTTNGLSIQIFDSSTVSSGNMSHLWFWGDGDSSTTTNPSHTYTNPGYYQICHVLNSSTNACGPNDSIVCRSVPIGINCQASFSHTTNNLTVSLLNSSTSNAPQLNYIWNFGNGQTSNAKNPVYTYSTSGLYIVCLEVFDPLMGCYSQFCDTISVGNGCVADFNYSINPTQNQTVNFTNNTQPQFGVWYNWDFGDGDTSSLKNPTHTYTSSGPYVVSLTVNTNFGGSCSYLDTVYANYCSSYFLSNVKANGTVTLFNQSEANPNTRFTWGFGDGSPIFSTFSKTAFSHTYTTSGTYFITLSISDPQTSCTSTYFDSVQIKIPNCQANFYYKQNQDTLYIESHSDSSFNHSYTFGDGSISTLTNPTHIYTQSGSYIVCQTIIDSSINCIDTYCDTIQVIVPQCSASFSISQSIDTLNISNQATDYNVISYDFGDGNTSNQENPRHVYAQSGTYIICQTVWDTSRNCQTSFCDTISVRIPKCKAGFTYQVVGDSLYFQSTAQNFTNIQYQFGDGNTSTETNPFHQYSQSNTYVVQQTVFNTLRNCSETFIDTISVTVSNSCIASYQVAIDTNQTNTLFLINNSSKVSSHQYFWDFGDGNIDTGRTPTHTYSTFGSYPICLTVQDPTISCTNTYCDTIGLDSNGNLTDKAGGFFLRVLDGSFIGLEEKTSIFDSFNLYPNPSSDNITISIGNFPNEIIEYEILNLKGQIKEKGKLTKDLSVLNINRLKNGVYILKLSIHQEVLVKKIIKQ